MILMIMILMPYSITAKLFMQDTEVPAIESRFFVLVFCVLPRPGLEPRTIGQQTSALTVRPFNAHIVETTYAKQLIAKQLMELFYQQLLYEFSLQLSVISHEHKVTHR